MCAAGVRGWGPRVQHGTGLIAVPSHPKQSGTTSGQQRRKSNSMIRSTGLFSYEAQ